MCMDGFGSSSFLEPHASAHGVQSSADDKSDWTTTGRINQVGCVAIMWLWSHTPPRTKPTRAPGRSARRSRFHNWTHGHSRPAVLLTRDWICHIHVCSQATLGRQVQLVDGVIRANLGEGPKPTSPMLGGGTLLGNTCVLSRSTLMVLTPYRYTSQNSLRPLPFNLKRK